MSVRKYIQLLVVLSTIFFTVRFNYEKVFAENNEVEKYEKDYLSRIYDSEDGLEGTTANCIWMQRAFFGLADIPDYTGMTARNLRNICWAAGHFL